MTTAQSIPIQTKLLPTVKKIPIEYFKWGKQPDHYIIDMPHRHNFAELLFFTNGGGIHEIDFNEHKVYSNAVHFIPKSTVHFLNRNINSDGFTIAFDIDYLEDNNVHRLINPLDETAFVLNLDISKFENLSQICKVITKQVKTNEEHYQTKCFLLGLELLLNEIAAENKLTISNTKCEVNELQLKFSKLLTTNIHQYSNVSWYALQLGISSKSLSNYLLKRGFDAPKQQIIKGSTRICVNISLN